MNTNTENAFWCGMLIGLLIGVIISSIVTNLIFNDRIVDIAGTEKTIEIRDARYRIEKVQELQWTENKEIDH